MPETLLDRVDATLAQHQMLAEGETVLVAVSGGADSVALVHALLELGHRVEIAHFDHVTREGASAADAAFVRALAERLGIPFHHERQDVDAVRLGSGQSFEECARQLRYAFLLSTARERGCAAVATGHHEDDVAETVLMRLLRGTSPAGLGGIPPVRIEEDIRIVRPLLDCTREAIRGWLSGRDIDWREDKSNQDTHHTRNRVRHDLIPTLIDDYNPQLTGALARLADAQRSDNALLDSYAEAAFKRCFRLDVGMDRQEFSVLHDALQRRCILLLAWRHGAKLPHDSIVGAVRFIADGATGKYFDLGGGLSLYQGRTHTRALTRLDERECGDPVSLEIPGDTDALGWHFEARFLESPPQVALADYCGPGRQVFDADCVGTALCVRRRRPGDTFRPFGMAGTRKLKDYFIDEGIPAPDRDGQPLIIAGEDIVWVVGKATSAETAVTTSTRRILEIRVNACV